MKEFKLSGIYYGFTVLFGVGGLMALKVGFSMLLGGNDGGKLLTWGFILIGALWVISALTMVLQAVTFKGTGLKMDKDGISDTLICVTIFAFYFAMPVKFIPWEAIQGVVNKKGNLLAAVNVYKIEAPLISKVLIKIFGYTFGATFVKPRVTEEDIKGFIKK